MMYLGHCYITVQNSKIFFSFWVYFYDCLVGTYDFFKVRRVKIFSHITLYIMPTTICVLIISVYDGDTSSYFETTILLFFYTFYCAIFRFVFLCITPVISSYDNHTSSQGYKIMLGSIFLLPGNIIQVY